MNILLTSVGCMGYVGLIKAFQEEGHKVFGVDCSSEAVGFKFCDGFSLVPHGDDADYIEYVLRACNYHKIDIVIPSSDNEILNIGENRDILESLGCKILLPSNETLNICNNKRIFYERLADWGITHPKMYNILDVEFPAIVKPEVGKGSTGVRKVFNLTDTSYLLDDYVIQDFIAGDEYTVDILADKTSGIVAMVKRKRNAIESGLSVQAEVEEMSEEEQLVCSRLNTRLDMVGMYCVQYIKNNTGIYVLEINPRFGGGSVLSLKADPSIIDKYINIVLDKPYLRHYNEPKILTMKRYYAEVYE
jgi:carbamoyl-phosphate synthase large subunit